MHSATNTLPVPSAADTRTRASLRRVGDRARNRRRQLSHTSDHARTSDHTHTTPDHTHPARLSTIIFRSTSWPVGRTRTRRRCTPPGAIRPATVEISGATVRVTWGWPSTRERSWHRRDVGFVCSSRTTDDDGATARLILITDKSRGDVVTATLACDGFSPEVYATLTRHLRNVEAIGDAERSDPFARLGAGPSAYPHTSR
jgi:hypothetical protein